MINLHLRIKSIIYLQLKIIYLYIYILYFESNLGAYMLFHTFQCKKLILSLFFVFLFCFLFFFFFVLRSQRIQRQATPLQSIMTRTLPCALRSRSIPTRSMAGRPALLWARKVRSCWKPIPERSCMPRTFTSIFILQVRLIFLHLLLLLKIPI